MTTGDDSPASGEDVAVTRDEFFATMGPLNVHPRIVNERFPYTSDWEVWPRTVVGRSVQRCEGGSVATRYYLVAPSPLDRKEPTL